MSARFLLDVHHLGLRQTGNEVWARNVVRAIESFGTSHGDREVHYALTDRGIADLPRSVGAERRHLVSTSSAKRLALDLPALCRRLRPDALLVQYTLPLTRVPGVVMIHDLSFEDPSAAEYMSRRALLRYRATVRLSARLARRITVPSAFTKDAIITKYHCKERAIMVASPALDPNLRALLSGLPSTTSDTGRTVLCVGNVLPRKNLEVVAHAVSRLRRRGKPISLLVAGSVPPAGQAIADRIRALLGSAVDFTGHVPLSELARCYRAADVFCFPSRYEGFGIPLLEAMAAEVPIVASTAASLPEVASDAAAYAAPDDPDGWAAVIDRVLNDTAAASQLVSAGRARLAAYRWEDAAATVLDALDQAAPAGAAGRRR
jgi:glycosyltransferase involved in cell wall biosynthesis